MTENFVNAAACGDLDDIKRMLADDNTSEETINHTDKDGRTALHYACLNDDINLLPILLSDKRVNVAKLTPNKECIFHLAALYNSLQALDMLFNTPRVMNHPAQLINAKNKFDETPLHLCAGTGNKQSGRTAIVLMENGASLACIDQWKRGPIDVAKYNGHYWLADILHAFLMKQPQAVIDAVNEISANSDKERVVAVEVSETAVEEQKKLKQLFAGGVKLNLKKTTTVEKTMFSSTAGKIVSADSSAPKAVIVSGKGLSKLIDFPGDREEIARLVKDPKVDVHGKDAFGLTALHKFASWNKPELIEMILPQTSPEQLNEVDLEGKSALHWACEMASVGSVKLLVAHGAKKDLKDKKGRTPLDILNTGQGDVIERLKAALDSL